MKRKLLLLVILFAFSAPIHAQNANAVIDKVVKKLDLVNDYSVDVVIKTDTDFLKSPATKAKIYYKKPDKFKVESQSFAALPKGGVNFLHEALTSGILKFEYAGKENKNGENLTKIKAVPTSDTVEVGDANLWIDESASVVKYVETSFEKNGTISISFEYGSQINYALPSKINLEFAFANISTSRRQSGEKMSINGKITISYGEYSINKGLSDDIFKEEKK
jgi:outer membrane lipoprotein-sorting protein